jgi:hypothetical protein
VTFAPYAMKAILWQLWGFINRRTYRDSYAPLDEHDIFEAIEHLTVRDEETSQLSWEHLQGRLSDLRHLIATLDTLEPRERRILQLRFVAGLEMPEICKCVKLSYAIVSTESARGVRKLQAHYGIQGGTGSSRTGETTRLHRAASIGRRLRRENNNVEVTKAAVL